MDEIGPSLRWASAKVTRAQRTNGGQQQGQPFGGQQQQGQQLGGGQQQQGQQLGGGQQQQGQQSQQQAWRAEDPWGGQQSAGGFGGQPNPNDPPF